MLPTWLRNPHLLLLLTALGWAGNAIAGKYAVGHISPMVLTFARWAIALVVITLIARHRIRHDWPVIRQHMGYFLLMGGIGYTGFNFLLYTALVYTSAVNVTIEQTAMPLFIFIMNFALYRTGITWLQVAGYLLTLVGVVITVTNGAPLELFETGLSHLNKGDLIMMVGALFYSIYSVGLRAKPDIHFQSFLAAMIFGAVIFALAGLVYEQSQDGIILPVTKQGWAVALYAGLVPSLLSQGFFMVGVAALGANRAGLYINLVPVFAAILVVLLLDEPLYLYHGLAFLIVVCGVMLSQRTSKKLVRPGPS